MIYEPKAKGKKAQNISLLLFFFAIVTVYLSNAVMGSMQWIMQTAAVLLLGAFIYVLVRWHFTGFKYEIKAKSRMPLPVAAMVALIVCTLTVLTVVTGSALVGRASDEVSELKNEAAVLAATERELIQELDRKNDLRTIERIAVDELGMIPTDLITKKYISFSGIDVIEAFSDDREESVGLATLLSAIGIGVE